MNPATITVTYADGSNRSWHVANERELDSVEWILHTALGPADTVDSRCAGDAGQEQ